MIKKRKKHIPYSIQCKHLHITWSTWDENMNRTACLCKTRNHAVRICRSFIVLWPSHHWYKSIWTTYLDNFAMDHAVSICTPSPDLHAGHFVSLCGQNLIRLCSPLIMQWTLQYVPPHPNVTHVNRKYKRKLQWAFPIALNPSSACNSLCVWKKKTSQEIT